MYRIFYFLIVFTCITELNASLTELHDQERESQKRTLKYQNEKQNLQLQTEKDNADYLRQRNVLDLKEKGFQHQLNEQYSTAERQVRSIENTLDLNEKIANNEKDLDQQKQRTAREFENLQEKTHQLCRGILRNVWDTTYNTVRNNKIAICCCLCGCITTCGFIPLTRFFSYLCCYYFKSNSTGVMGWESNSNTEVFENL
jgi:hypothetical protein